MKMSFHRYLLFLGVLLFFATALTGCRLFPKENVETVPTLVDPADEDIVTHTVTVGSITEEIKGYAQINSGKEEKLSFTVPGRIHEVLVKSGDDVKKGQVIAVLETGDLNFAILRAKAQLEQQQLLYEQKYNDNELRKHAPDYYEKRLAELNIKCAQIELDRLQQQVDNSVLTAAFSGKISSLSAEKGQVVEPYSEMALLTDVNTLEMTSDLKPEDALHINIGTRVKIQMEEGDPQMGMVVGINKPKKANGSDSDTRIATIRMDNRRFSLKLQDSYDIVFCLRSVPNALLVPNDAIREDVNGRKYLRVLEGKHRREVYVKIGIQTDTQTQILEGAKAGMIVIGK